MLKKQKVIAGIGALVMMISAGVMSVSAATLTAHLASDQTVVYSGKQWSVGGGTLWGKNHETSAGNVWVIAKYQTGAIWRNGGDLLIGRGGEMTTTPNTLDQSRTWQLGINPEGANKYGCTADGSLTIN